MLTFLPLILLVLVAYLLGSISSAIVTSRLMGLPDPRTTGSGNPGATNVLRVGGKKAGIITLLGDLLKGFLPVIAVRWLHFSDTIIALIAFAAFLGHLYPIYFRFKGGKGVATGLGVLLGMNLLLGGIVLAVWIVIFALFRYSSLAALTAVAIGLVAGWWLLPLQEYIASACIGLLVYWRHQGNIIRLIQGTETKMQSQRT